MHTPLAAVAIRLVSLPRAIWRCLASCPETLAITDAPTQSCDPTLYTYISYIPSIWSFIALSRLLFAWSVTLAWHGSDVDGSCSRAITRNCWSFPPSPPYITPALLKWAPRASRGPKGKASQRQRYGGKNSQRYRAQGNQVSGMLIPFSIQWCIKVETAREYQTESGSDSELYIVHAL